MFTRFPTKQLPESLIYDHRAAFKIIGLLDYLIMGQQHLLYKAWVAQNDTETIPTHSDGKT